MPEELREKAEEKTQTAFRDTTTSMMKQKKKGAFRSRWGDLEAPPKEEVIKQIPKAQKQEIQALHLAADIKEEGKLNIGKMFTGKTFVEQLALAKYLRKHTTPTQKQALEKLGKWQQVEKQETQAKDQWNLFRQHTTGDFHYSVSPGVVRTYRDGKLASKTAVTPEKTWDYYSDPSVYALDTVTLEHDKATWKASDAKFWYQDYSRKEEPHAPMTFTKKDDALKFSHIGFPKDESRVWQQPTKKTDADVFKDEAKYAEEILGTPSRDLEFTSKKTGTILDTVKIKEGQETFTANGKLFETGLIEPGSYHVRRKNGEILLETTEVGVPSYFSSHYIPSKDHKPQPKLEKGITAGWMDKWSDIKPKKPSVAVTFIDPSSPSAKVHKQRQMYHETPAAALGETSISAAIGGAAFIEGTARIIPGIDKKEVYSLEQVATSKEFSTHEKIGYVAGATTAGIATYYAGGVAVGAGLSKAGAAVSAKSATASKLGTKYGAWAAKHPLTMKSLFPSIVGTSEAFHVTTDLAHGKTKEEVALRSMKRVTRMVAGYAGLRAGSQYASKVKPQANPKIPGDKSKLQAKTFTKGRVDQVNKLDDFYTYKIQQQYVTEGVKGKIGIYGKGKAFGYAGPSKTGELTGYQVIDGKMVVTQHGNILGPRAVKVPVKQFSDYKVGASKAKDLMLPSDPSRIGFLQKHQAALGKISLRETTTFNIPLDPSKPALQQLPGAAAKVKTGTIQIYDPTDPSLKLGLNQLRLPAKGSPALHQAKMGKIVFTQTEKAVPLHKAVLKGKWDPSMIKGQRLIDLAPSTKSPSTALFPPIETKAFYTGKGTVGTAALKHKSQMKVMEAVMHTKKAEITSIGVIHDTTMPKKTIGHAATKAITFQDPSQSKLQLTMQKLYAPTPGITPSATKTLQTQAIQKSQAIFAAQDTAGAAGAIATGVGQQEVQQQTPIAKQAAATQPQQTIYTPHLATAPREIQETPSKLAGIQPSIMEGTMELQMQTPTARETQVYKQKTGQIITQKTTPIQATPSMTGTAQKTGLIQLQKTGQLQIQKTTSITPTSTPITPAPPMIPIIDIPMKPKFPKISKRKPSTKVRKPAARYKPSILGLEQDITIPKPPKIITGLGIRKKVKKRKRKPKNVVPKTLVTPQPQSLLKTHKSIISI